MPNYTEQFGDSYDTDILKTIDTQCQMNINHLDCQKLS